MSAEIGDTWMYGVRPLSRPPRGAVDAPVPSGRHRNRERADRGIDDCNTEPDSGAQVSSDPNKLAKLRAMARAYGVVCKPPGQSCAPQPGLGFFLQNNVKLAEHTWGGQSGAHLNVSATEVEAVWTAAELAVARRRGGYTFIDNLEATWTEQRGFADAALSALAPSPLKTAVEEAFFELEAPLPVAASLAAKGYKAVPRSAWGAPVELHGAEGRGWGVQVDPLTGGLTQLVPLRAAAAGVGSARDWAAASPLGPQKLGLFGYRTHSYADQIKYQTTYGYRHGGQHPYPKPNPDPNPSPSPANCTTMNGCKTVSKLWRAAVVGMWAKSDSVVLELALPAALMTFGYGAPAEIWSNFTLAADGAVVQAELAWGGKLPARLLESTFFEFRPRLNATEDGWRLMLDKLGSRVDAGDVVDGGGSVAHGVDPDGGLTFAPASGGGVGLRVKSLDAGLVLPGRNMDLYNFSAYYGAGNEAKAVDGAAFSLHNNLYDTNYVMWYPWLAADSVARFRFELSEV
jgi:hypothetical protein